MVSDKKGLMRAKTMSNMYDSLMMWISRKRSGKVLYSAHFKINNNSNIFFFNCYLGTCMMLATDLTYSVVTCMTCERLNPAMSTAMTSPDTCDFCSRATISRQR